MTAESHPESRGHRRRTLFKAGTGTAAAAAVVVGLGSEAGAVESTAPAVDRGRLTASDPHAYTARTVDRGRAQTADGDIGITILPFDRAVFRAGGRFDLRVEVTGVDPASARVELRIADADGEGASVLDGEPERAVGAMSTEMVVEYKQIAYPRAGDYTITVIAEDGERSAEAVVEHEVRGAGRGEAKNVIFFLGDGMDQAPITGARLLSKGITKGKYDGLLHMDRMDYRGSVTTSGADAIATDSANSASAYSCGHKTSVNAMGVYESSATDPNGHPRVETMAELLKRCRGMGVGIVSTAEIQDASPAAMWAHTRARSEYLDIMDQALEATRTPDVILGGGLASLLPQSEEDSGRDDDRDLVKEFEELGFAFAKNRGELNDAIAADPEKLLGLFHTGNMDVYLDRQHSPDKDRLGEWDDQPTLVEMTKAALGVLEDREEGFFLFVEAASIDKMSHPMDGPRVIYDTIEFDQAIGAAKEWAEDREDTLIVITADHAHAMSIVGTHDSAEQGRDGNGVYADSGFPNYVDSDGDGFPDDPNPSVGLFFGWSNHPDHTDDFEHNHEFGQPALVGDDGVAVPNPDRDPDAELQTGNLPFSESNCVHTVQDVPVYASGPGAEAFNAVLDNTEVFHNIVDALGIDALDQ